MKKRKIIAITLIACMMTFLLSACAPLIKINDVKKDPAGAIKKAFYQVLEDVEGMSYNPLKTGAAAVNSGKIEIKTTNTSGQDLLITLNQNPEGKDYSTTMRNTSTGDGWKWVLDNGVAFLQIGPEGSDYYSIDLKDPAAAVKNSKIAELLNMSPVAAESILTGEYPTFLDRYNSETEHINLNEKVTETLVGFIENEPASVEDATTLGGIEAVQVSYTITSENMRNLVDALNTIRLENNFEYDSYVSNLLRYVLRISGCEFYGNIEQTQGMRQKWKNAVNDLKLYLLMSDADFSLSFAINKKTGNIANISIFSSDVISDEAVTVQINADFIELSNKKTDWVFEFQVSNKSGLIYDSHIIITNTIQNNSDYFRSHMIFEYRDKYEIWKDNYLIDYNKHDNSFGVYTSRDDQELGVFGTVVVMGQEMRMIIEQVQHKDKEYNLNVSITANDVLESITPPVAIQINTLTIDELKRIQIQVIETLPSSVFGSWKSLQGADILD